METKQTNGLLGWKSLVYPVQCPYNSWMMYNLYTNPCSGLDGVASHCKSITPTRLYPDLELVSGTSTATNITGGKMLLRILLTELHIGYLSLNNLGWNSGGVCYPQQNLPFQ